ncbi:MAG: chorismate mutase [Candidatus Bathyarchaeia archaeon]|nr:chorismate mutase [Candidatus Bathyarchaeota archaeon]
MEKIAALRQKIDEIDEKILLLLKERIEVSKKIGEIKQKQGIPVRDPKREEEKYKHISEKAAEFGLDAEDVKNLFQKIIDISIRIQKSE